MRHRNTFCLLICILKGNINFKYFTIRTEPYKQCSLKTICMVQLLWNSASVWLLSIQSRRGKIKLFPWWLIQCLQLVVLKWKTVCVIQGSFRCCWVQDRFTLPGQRHFHFVNLKASNESNVLLSLN